MLPSGEELALHVHLRTAAPTSFPSFVPQTIRDNGRKSLFIAQVEDVTPPESVVNTKCVDFRDVMPPGLNPTVHSYTEGTLMASMPLPLLIHLLGHPFAWGCSMHMFVR